MKEKRQARWARERKPTRAEAARRAILKDIAPYPAGGNFPRLPTVAAGPLGVQGDDSLPWGGGKPQEFKMPPAEWAVPTGRIKRPAFSGNFTGEGWPSFLFSFARHLNSIVKL